MNEGLNKAFNTQTRCSSSEVQSRLSVIILLDSFLFVFDGNPESLLQEGQLTDQIRDGIGEGLLGAVIWCRLDSDDDFVF